MSPISKRLRQQFDSEDPYNRKGMIVGLAKMSVSAADLDRLLGEHEELERELAEQTRALDAYKSRDGDCPAWLRPTERRAVTNAEIEAAYRKWDKEAPVFCERRNAFKAGYRAALEAGEDE